MEINEQKHNIESMMATKKYKLSFFGISPKHDWNVVFNIGVALLVAASLIYYFDGEIIKSSVSEDSLFRQEKKVFDIEKAKTIIKDFKKEKGLVDQTQ